jgi:hypothetical protein
MSYEEEDTCHMRRRIHVTCTIFISAGPFKPCSAVQGV